MSGSKATWVVPFLLVETVVLAVLELFFLPLRFDGELLPKFHDWPFPITILVAVVTTPLLVMAASRFSNTMMGAGSPLFVWLTTLVVLGLFGPGGDMLLPNDWRSLMLLAGGALPGAIAVGAVMAKPR